MKPIRLIDANRDAIAAALTEATGRTERTVTAAEVYDLTDQAIDKLSGLGISRAQAVRLGAVITIDPIRNRQPSTKSYGHRASAIMVTIEPTATGYSVTDVSKQPATYETAATRHPFRINLGNDVNPRAMLNQMGITVAP